MGADPVKLGIVASLNQPGANITGVYQFYGALGGKRLERLRELVPSASLIAVLTNPKIPTPRIISSISRTRRVRWDSASSSFP